MAQRHVALFLRSSRAEPKAAKAADTPFPFPPWNILQQRAPVLVLVLRPLVLEYIPRARGFPI